MPQFSNPSLKEALAKMRQDQKRENVQAVLEELMSGQVLAPATWDKEPVKNEKGQLVFEPDTKFSLMVLSNQNQELYFPMFSDMASLQAWNPDKNIQSLVLSWEQFLSFAKLAEKDVKGIVFNPGTENIPFDSKFLLGAKEASATPHLSPNKLNKGDTVYVREPASNVDDLRLALETAGGMVPEVGAIYLKERVNPEDENDKGHWFIIVDADKDDTQIFERIGHSISNFAHGKEIEFIFGSARLAQNIMQSSQPVYARPGYLPSGEEAGNIQA